MDEFTTEEQPFVEELPEQAPPVEPADDILCQSSYLPTPFESSAWEIVGEQVEEREFVPMDLQILPASPLSSPDPMFEQFDADEQRSSEFFSHAPDVVVTSEKELEAQGEYVENLEAQLEAKYQEGLQAGLDQAQEAAQAEENDQAEQNTEKLGQVTRLVAQESMQLFTRMEKEAVALALDVSKKILETTADVKPDYIIDVIRKALKSLGAGQPVRIRLSPDDHEFVEVVGLPADLSTSELGVEYVMDENIKGGCIVETDFGEVDLQLEKMWEQVRESIYEALK